MRPTVIVLSFIAVLTACSGSETATVPSTTLDTNEATSTTTGDAPAPTTAELETTTTTNPTTATTQPDGLRSGDDAAALWIEYTDAASAYFDEGLTGDGWRIGLIEEAGMFYSRNVQLDVIGAHDCFQDTFTTTRLFLEDDAEYESTVDVLEVIDVNEGLWVVRYRSVQFLTGIGDQVNEASVFVNSDGIIGASNDFDDPTCWAMNTDPTDETIEQLALALEADRG